MFKNGKTNINIIAACDNKFGIGKDGKLPWSYKEDLQLFKRLTTNNILIMGRKTVESIPVLLTNRTIFVLSKTLYNKAKDPSQAKTSYPLDRLSSETEHRLNLSKFQILLGVNYCFIMKDLDTIISFVLKTPIFTLKTKIPEIFIAGGGEIYNLVNEHMKDKHNREEYNYILHITKIDKDYQCDTFLNIPMKDWYTMEKRELINRENIQIDKDVYGKKANKSWEDIKRRCLENESPTKNRGSGIRNSNQGNSIQKPNSYRNSGDFIFHKINENVVYYKKAYVQYGERQYLDLLEDIVNNGDFRQTRNAKTYSLFNKQLTFDLRDGFPLLTTKKMFFRGIVEELLFFLRGDTNTKHLEEKGINIWKGNTNRQFLDTNPYTKEYKEGDMGPMYGYQLRRFNRMYDGCHRDYDTDCDYNHDQLYNVLQLLQNDKYSRRILMTTYNPAQAEQGVLYPCHSLMIQFYVTKSKEDAYTRIQNIRPNEEGINRDKDNTDYFPEYYLDMYCYNRSSDAFLGLPFNIASSALLLTLIAKAVGYVPRYLYLSLGDVHIYETHMASVNLQIKREPYIFPNIEVKNVSVKSLLSTGDEESINYSDICLKDYTSHDSIKEAMIE